MITLLKSLFCKESKESTHTHFADDLVEALQSATDKTEPPEPKKSITNKFTIWFNDNTQLSWSITDFKEKSKVASWKHFYHWYFGRTDSESYVFSYKNGETMFQRKDIKRFDVKLIEVVEQVKIDYDEYDQY